MENRLRKAYIWNKKIRLAIVTSYFHLVRSVKLAEKHIENADIEGIKADFPFDNPSPPCAQ